MLTLGGVPIAEVKPAHLAALMRQLRGEVPQSGRSAMSTRRRARCSATRRSPG
jgi:hypothetical protein